MRKIIWLIMVLSLGGSLVLQAQEQRTITGTVIDNNSEGVPAASIKVKGTVNGTTTDIDGKFILSIPLDTVILEVMALASERQEVHILPGCQEITITMKAGNQSLEEVSIYGQVVSHYSYTGSKSAISSATISRNSDRKPKGSTWKRSGLPENSIRLEIGDEDYLPLEAAGMAVQVDGFRVRVLVDCFFYNDKKDGLEGTFKLRLPAGASPYYFAFGETVYADDDHISGIPYVDYLKQGFHLSPEEIATASGRSWDNIKEARIVSRQKAARAYEQTVSARIDPALMEWAGADMFSCRVFPLSKGKLHRVVIGYDLNMTEALDFREYLLQLPDVKKNLRLSVDMAAGKGLEPVISPSVPSVNTGSRQQLSLQDPKEKSYTIRYNNTDPILLYDSLQACFGASYRISLPESVQADLPSDAVFLLDVSLSANPDKFNVWLKLMEEVLRKNKDVIKRFSVLMFHIEQQWWQPAFVKNNNYNVQAFLDYAQTLALEGATDLSAAMAEASHPYWLKSSAPKQIFLMTDGDYNWGESNLTALQEVLNKGDRVHTYKTGLPGTNTGVLNTLSQVTGGFAFTVTGEEEAVLTAQSLRYRPWTIEAIKVDGVEDFLVSGQPTQLYNGQKLIVAGRGKPNGNIYLKLSNGLQTQELTLPAVQQLSSGLSARIYGQLALASLQPYGENTKEATEAYAQHFRIPGETMSFLMLDNQSDYDRYDIDDSKSESYVEDNTIAALSAELAEKGEGMPLGNNKAGFLAWLQRLSQHKDIQFDADTLFMEYVRQLPEATFSFREAGAEAHLLFASQQTDIEVDMLADDDLKYDRLLPVAALRMKEYGNRKALVLMSSVIEKNPADYTALRDLALKATDWDMGTQAYQLIRRIISAREQEANAYLVAARALEQAGRNDLALIYYQVCTRSLWDKDYGNIAEIAALYEHRLLGRMLGQTGRDTAAGKYLAYFKAGTDSLLRHADMLIDEADAVIILTWNRDNTDIDLHVQDPAKEECFYNHPVTKGGGRLSLDVTEGFGPEMYVLENAAPGQYHSWLEYFSDDRTKTSSAAKAYVEYYRNWGRSNERCIKKLILLEKPGTTLVAGGEDDDRDDHGGKDDKFDILRFKIQKKAAQAKHVQP